VVHERLVTPINQNLRCNEQIRVSPLRVIGPENEQLGILANYEALRMAREQGLDLVEVAPNVRPPVCRIMDYGKWKYNQKKNVKRHHEQQTKEVRLRPKTDTHDREIKVHQAIRFFKRGDKVQFTMQFRGRERFRKEVALEIFREILDHFGTRVKVERPPSMDGRHMVMILSGLKDAFVDVQVGDEKDDPQLHADDDIDDDGPDDTEVAESEPVRLEAPQQAPSAPAGTPPAT
jgi:translation initiation factor IF-3